MALLFNKQQSINRILIHLAFKYVLETKTLNQP